MMSAIPGRDGFELSAAPEQIAAALEAADAESVVRWAADSLGADLVVATSFGLEDVVLLDMVLRLCPAVTVFSLDTGRLPEETYAVAEAFRERGAAIRWYFPDFSAVEALERNQGLYSFRTSVEQRKECCRVRKVEPLGRALSGCRAWATGLRREQALTRESLRVLELDAANGGILKLSPLASWSLEQTWQYVRDHRLPYNRLHDRGYPSIGCSPCTRHVEPGEHPRAGRWWWELPEHKECGLHCRPVAPAVHNG